MPTLERLQQLVHDWQYDAENHYNKLSEDMCSALYECAKELQDILDNEAASG